MGYQFSAIDTKQLQPKHCVVKPKHKVSYFAIVYTTFVFFLLFFEVDKKKDTFPVTGKMHVDLPADVTDEELKEIQNVLAQTLADSLGCSPDQIKVTIDPETGEATYVITTNDPNLADEMQKMLKTEDFAENVNKAISEKSQHLPKRIREVLAIKDMKVNTLFQN